MIIHPQEVEVEEVEGMEWFLKLLNLNVGGVQSGTGRGGGVGVVIGMVIGIEDGMIGIGMIGIGMIEEIVIDVTAIVIVIGIGNVRGKVIGIEIEIGRGIERGIEV